MEAPPSAVDSSLPTEAAERMGYRLTIDNSSVLSGRLMIEQGGVTMFVTMTKESGVTVIHYSESGKVEKMEIPSSR
jgi:hypothetical protein